MIEIRRPVLKPYSKDRFVVVRSYQTDVPLSGDEIHTIKIPAGYMTNGADIPRVFWSIFPPNSPEYLSAVVVHDFLCDRARKKEDFRQADEIFYEMMIALEVSKWKCRVFYLACRAYHKIKELRWY
ncbi:Protein of uncharacterised function (DUF1353) [Campylobacter hyointestinalis subsp. hyointestinalis]|uniref:Protein of uncharacterized function (DUF1353) n=1 Tax=Campylobacter hyointestinalis subsp. hyointestinalis TaxID=91352 RepID=A0A9W5APU9_CAMHY|nr:DUF1353 domain-containing protein [Campylobacter hyointestinalis]CUU77311.1 Protein of uncharacterised function (DUF1353) [Campylobacter hyointestinalis subsp. hyointestinalis]